MSVDLNKSEEFVKELKIFNDGNAGIVENVKLTIERKEPGGDPKRPDYKLIATDSKGASINEGFYYQEEGSKGFTGYQAQRLIMLARGVFGDDVKFPVWNTTREVLDGVMKMVAPALNKPFRVAACYGTTKNPSRYLGFKNFGSFIQPMTVTNTLSFNNSDNTVKAPSPTPTAADTLLNKNTDESNESTNVDNGDLSWLNG